MREDLNTYSATYENDPFEKENNHTIKNFINKVISYCVTRDSILELGIGHGVNLELLSENFRTVTILEGSREIIAKFQGKYSNIKIIDVFFEEFITQDRFNTISMGFILEHVDDPELILQKYRRFLSKGGSIYIGVPNAGSLHRLIAQKAGMLSDINTMSAVDVKFGHKRFLTFDQWENLLQRLNFKIKKAEGLYLKPFTTHQLESLNLSDIIVEAMIEIASAYPEISNSCFFEVGNE